MTAASGRPPAIPLARGHQIGHDLFVLAGEPVAGAGESGLHLVGHEHDTVVACPIGQRRKETGCGHDESAFALDRFDHDRRDVLRAHLLLDQRDGATRGLLAGERGAVVSESFPEGIGHRHPVHLGRERAETVLVRHVLRGHRHRQVRAAVVGVIEHHDGIAAGGAARDLHRVLDRFGATVEQHRALGVVTGGQFRESLGDLDVPLVRGDHETGMGESPGLFPNCLDDSRIGGTDARDGDSGTEVDQ